MITHSIFLLIFVLGVFPVGVTQEADRLYRQEEYEQAGQKYREALQSHPDSAMIEFNLGTALYKQDNYGEAAGHFQQSLLSDDDNLRRRAHYNLGNTFYRQGIAQEDTDLEAAIQQLEKSVDHLKESLKIKPDPDGEHNLEFVLKELERLKQKKKQQDRQQRQQQKNQRQNKKDQQQENQQNSGGQGQSGDGGDKKDSGERQKPDGRKDDQSDGQQGRDNQEQQSRQQPGNEENREDQGGQSRQQSPRAGDDGQRMDGASSFVFGGQSGEPAEDFDEKEARKLIEEYKQNEEPGRTINFLRGQQPAQQSPVRKDW